MITYKHIKEKWRVVMNDKILTNHAGEPHDGGGYDELIDCITHIRSIGDLNDGLWKWQNDEKSKPTGNGRRGNGEQRNRVHGKRSQGGQQRNDNRKRGDTKARPRQSTETDTGLVC